MTWYIGSSTTVAVVFSFNPNFLDFEWFSSCYNKLVTTESAWNDTAVESLLSGRDFDHHDDINDVDLADRGQLSAEPKDDYMRFLFEDEEAEDFTEFQSEWVLDRLKFTPPAH